jgi:threonine-phosphate decarboxylase
LRELVHGGDIYSDRGLPPGTELLDFSANINPLGMPPAVREALVNCADACAVYPDPLCGNDIAIAASEGVPAEWTICGAGAAVLLSFGLPCARRAQVITPTFSEYAALWPRQAADTFHYT